MIDIETVKKLRLTNILLIIAYYDAKGDDLYHFLRTIFQASAASQFSLITFFAHADDVIVNCAPTCQARQHGLNHVRRVSFAVDAAITGYKT
ncbi:MAG: hypothetical protein PF630_10310 [Gammaproteobacteria bacterium]|nr:hypothetical protein [Gammaproteobacteria bacterium]